MFKHILLPTDGTDFSRKTTLGAIALAKESGAKITAFYAIPGCPAAWLDADAAVAEDYDQKATQLADKYLREIKAKCTEAGIECATLSEPNDVPFQAIIEAAEKCGCDLIFMASHGRRGLISTVLGDATNKVINHTTVSVLVFRV